MAIVDISAFGNLSLIVADADPSSSGNEIDAPIGSLAVLTDGSAFYFKSSAATNGWSKTLLGTGTTNYVSKFTGSGVLGNSTIQDTGTAVSTSVGFTAPLVTSGALTLNSAASTSAETWAGSTNSGTAFIGQAFGTTTTLNASSDFFGFKLSGINLTEAATGTHNLLATVGLQGLAVTEAAGSTTNAATLYIGGAATGTATITNNYAVWVDSGTVRLDGEFELQTIPSASTSNILYYNTTTKRVSYSAVPITSLGTSGNGQTGTTQILATSTTGTDFTITSATDTHTFNLPSASATARGLITTGTQTIAGQKTFSSAIDLTSGQIIFPGTQSDAAGANTLDDYEEGTFTPALQSTGATFAYSSQVGAYTKVGNKVSITFRIALNTTGNSGFAGNPVSVTGLPFASGNVTNRNFVGDCTWSNLVTSLITMPYQQSANTQTLLLYKITAAAASVNTRLVATDLSTTAGTIITGTYTYLT